MIIKTFKSIFDFISKIISNTLILIVSAILVLIALVHKEVVNQTLIGKLIVVGLLVLGLIMVNNLIRIDPIY